MSERELSFSALDGWHLTVYEGPPWPTRLHRPRYDDELEMEDGELRVETQHDGCTVIVYVPNEALVSLLRANGWTVKLPEPGRGRR